MRRGILLSTVGLFLLVVACAGGGSGGGGTPPPPPPPPPLAITTASLPLGTVGQAYSAALAATGGTGTLTWRTTNTLPPGLTLESNGRLSGTPQSPHELPIRIEVTDSGTPPRTAVKDFLLDIFGLVLMDALPDALLEFSYQTGFGVMGGVEPVSFSIVSGALPSGLELVIGSSGTTRGRYLRGTPTVAGDYQFTVRSSDASNPARTHERVTHLSVKVGGIAIANNDLPLGVIGLQYTGGLIGKGGAKPYAWTIRANPDLLPPGLTLNPATGNITGIPSLFGRWQFMVEASDSQNPPSTAAKTLSLLVTDLLPPRNDTLATATALPFGNYNASLSPYEDPVTAVKPDIDYYKVTASTGAVLTVSAGASSTDPPVDTVIEILDGNGQRLTSCRDLFDDPPLPSGAPIDPDPTPNDFDDPCMNDDHPDIFSSSFLWFKVPGVSGSVTFYIRVFNWRGDARPDMKYMIAITSRP